MSPCGNFPNEVKLSLFSVLIEVCKCFHYRFIHYTFVNFYEHLLSNKPYILLNGRDYLVMFLNSGYTLYLSRMPSKNIGSWTNSQILTPNSDLIISGETQAMIFLNLLHDKSNAGVSNISQ